MVNHEVFKLFLKIHFTLVLYVVIFISAFTAILHSRIVLAIAIMYIGFWLSHTLRYYVKKLQVTNLEIQNDLEPNNSVSDNESMNNSGRPSNIYTISGAYENANQSYWNLNERSEVPPRYETLYSLNELPPAYETAVNSKSVKM